MDPIELTPGSLLALVILAGDGVGGLLCVRARRYPHAIGLGGIVVPLCLVVAAMTFSRAAGSTVQYDPEAKSMLLVGFGALAMATLSVAWMLWVGLRGLRLVNERRTDRYGEAAATRHDRGHSTRT